MNTFIEQICVIELEGRHFESGGAWLLDCSDGYRRGVVYVKPNTGPIADMRRFACPGIVTNWHGNKIADARFGSIYRGGFGARMRSVYFTLDGITYTGRYGCDWSQACRVKSTKKVS